MVKINLYKPKKDQYSRVRGGYSKLLDIYCSRCKQFVLSYQKDGPGILKRLYLDRIFAPASLVNLVGKDHQEVLNCQQCANVIGTQYIYKKENRKAFRLKQGTFSKKIKPL